MKLPDFRDFDLRRKRVLLRTNYDVPLTSEGKIADETRIEDSLPTIKHLLQEKAKIIIISHLGRPKGKKIPNLSLKPIVKILQNFLPGTEVRFQVSPAEFKIEDGEIFLLENLRFNPGEEENSFEFAKSLSLLGDFYINDAFACSHRCHASIVGLPSFLPAAAGFDLLREVKILSQVLEKPKRPVVVILGGVKEDKLEAISGLLSWVDKILIGGRLVNCPKAKIFANHSLKLAILKKSGKDIDLSSVEDFVKEIKEAGTIIWNGPLGKYEEKEWEKGTKIFAQAVCQSSAFKIIGGGDTEAALTKFSLIDKIDYVSSGGGAMLEFLAKGDLPGLKALRG
jgi:phosphoglycerate kinase